MAATATNFVMRGAREAMAGGFAHIEEQVKGIEWAVAENPCLAFDLSKTLIESICRTILTERDINFSRKDDLLRLFHKVKQHLPFLPPDASHVVEIRRSLDQTLNGLHAAIQGICELRNKCGYASHGSSEPQPSIESVQAFLAAEAADTIVGFLHRIHRQDRAPIFFVATSYDENPDFNESIDESHGMLRIFEVEFRPSEVLFQMEPETYRVCLAEFDSQADITAVDTTEPEL